MVIIGLGNPGAQYALTRHNIGFMAVDSLAQTHDFPPFKRWNHTLLTERTIHFNKVTLLKPMMFMNCSGVAVSEFISFYKISLDNVIVIHDDLDVLPGQIKIKQGGGAAGHNGLKSLDCHIGQNYWRIRLGIGHPGSSHNVSHYVLQNFSESEKDWLISLLHALTKESSSLFEKDKSIFLNNVRSRCQLKS